MKAAIRKHFETKDAVISQIVSSSAPYELNTPRHGSAFEVLARSIASQQISGAVARKMIERLMALHGNRFPLPAEIAAATPESLRGVGFSFAKVAALHDLAAHALDGRLPDDATLAALDDEAIIARCTPVRGIGRWTVQMLLMFHLCRHDVMPADDYGVRLGFKLAYGLKGLPKPKALLAYAERWKPYRSAGAWFLWRAVELHQQGKLPRRPGRAPRIEIEQATPAKLAVKKANTRKRKVAARRPRKRPAVSKGRRALRR